MNKKEMLRERSMNEKEMLKEGSMNRAERRRLSKVKKLPTFNVDQAQLQNLIDKGVEERVKQVRDTTLSMAITSISSAFTISLHDEYGFGPQRLQNLISKVQLQFECIEAGTVTLEEMLQWCLEYGVDIKEWGKSDK